MLDVWLEVTEATSPELVGESVYVDSDGTVTATRDGVWLEAEWAWDDGRLDLWTGSLHIGHVDVTHIGDCWRGHFSGLLYNGEVGHLEEVSTL